MQDDEQPAPAARLVQPPQQHKQQQKRDIARKSGDNRGQRNGEQNDDLAGIRAIMFDLEQDMQAQTDRIQVLGDWLKDLEKQRADAARALDNRLAMGLETIIKEHEAAQHLIRLVLVDPRQAERIRKAAEKLTTGQTSMPTKGRDGFGQFLLWTVLGVLGIGALVWLS